MKPRDALLGPQKIDGLTSSGATLIKHKLSRITEANLLLKEKGFKTDECQHQNLEN